MSEAHIKRINIYLQRGLDLIFPPRCAGCWQRGELLCQSCLQTMQPLTTPICQHCGISLSTPGVHCMQCQYQRLHIDGLRSVHLYQDALRQAIHALKYAGQRRLAQPLGMLMAQAFQHYRMHVDSIVPLPLHAQRQQKRGYNQATLLARSCAAHLKVPCLENIIIRQRDTRPQVGLKARERQANVKEAFALATNIQTQGLATSTILLIDDVCTTGATLEACAAPLYASGVRAVWGLVLARPSGLVQDT
jgi:ComF family protein